jgi:hypothetical protein
MSEPAGGPIRVRVIAQETERMFVELTLPGPFWPASMPLDIEVLYPDGSTVRYSREID